MGNGLFRCDGAGRRRGLVVPPLEGNVITKNSLYHYGKAVLIQLLIFIVALVGLVCEIFREKK